MGVILHRISPADLETFAGAPEPKTHQDMKQIIAFFALIGALVAQVYFLGISGLTLLSIPITLYLGLDILEYLGEPEPDENPEEQPNK